MHLLKSYIFTFVISIITICSYSQNLFYYTQIGKTYLDGISNKKIYIRFKDSISVYQKNEILRINIALQQIDTKKTYSRSSHSINVNEFLNIREVLDIIDNLFLHPDVVYVSPYYYTETGSHIVPTDQIAVKLYCDSDINRLIMLACDLNLKIVKSAFSQPGVFHLELTKKYPMNTILLANYLYETDLFFYARPNFLMENGFRGF